MPNPDLRILALADAKVLPPQVQEKFDQWRIDRARDAVTSTVRKRLIDEPILSLYLERLEQATDERTIFEGIYALAEVVEVFRQRLGIHSQYLMLMMSGQLNPWGLLEFNPDFEHPATSIISAAAELWRLATEYQVDVPALLAKIKPDETLIALEAYYQKPKDK